MNVSQTPPVNPAPQASAPVSPQGGDTDAGVLRLDVPLEIPKDMYTPDPKTGKMPIDDFQVQLVPRDAQIAPRDAIITNTEEVQKLVAQIREETLPEGMMPRIADSKGGALVAKGKATVGSLGQMAGGLGVYNLAGWGSWGMAASTAAHVAGIGGAIGLLMGADQLKEALDAKAFYEGLKAKGTTTLPVPAPVTGPDGKTVMGVREIPIDDVIGNVKDKAVGSGIGMVSSGLMIAAALGAPPLVAVGAVVLGLGGALYQMKGLFAALGKKVAEKVKGMFGKDDADKAAKPQVVPAGSPEVAAAKDASAPAPALKQGEAPAAPAAPQGLTPEQIQQTTGRIQELQAQLMANPDIAGTLQQMQEMIPQAMQDPKAAEELAKVEAGLKQHPTAGPVYEELQKLQTALLSDPGFQQMLVEEQAALAAAQQKAQ